MRAGDHLLAATLLVTAGVASAAGDAARGALLYEARCGACHSIDAHRVGPLHRGVVGRRAGSAPGYDYSPALAAAGFVWDASRLAAWLRDPEALVPGQRMAYSVPEAADRNDLVAYLKSVSSP
ncbi:c-type cytochrome [Accumulibacter sp.]|uniref:c-type cytochrome n=1 Tax=Accumulibacter sp. TaxID=2053492 RepID=UPI0026210328|nr:c-type cytochrome [Accumulibacter sp.]